MDFYVAQRAFYCIVDHNQSHISHQWKDIYPHNIQVKLLFLPLQDSKSMCDRKWRNLVDE